MEKPIKHAISLIIKNSEDKTLFALRSKLKESYPLVWSLPSASIRVGESHDDVIKRIGKEKLGVELNTIRLLNEGKSDRGEKYTFYA